MSLAVELVVVAVILAVVFKMRSSFNKQADVMRDLLLESNADISRVSELNQELGEELETKNDEIDNLKVTINLDRNLIIEMEDEMAFMRKEMIRLVKDSAKKSKKPVAPAVEKQLKTFNKKSTLAKSVKKAVKPAKKGKK